MGTRDAIRAAATTSKDHPHAYGDKHCAGGRTRQPLGSSPRVWGQVHSGFHTLMAQRIIPTRMGTSEQLVSQINSRKDHPHAYGDKSANISATVIPKGSSPRVWGQVK